MYGVSDFSWFNGLKNFRLDRGGKEILFFSRIVCESEFVQNKLRMYVLYIRFKTTIIFPFKAYPF